MDSVMSTPTKCPPDLSSEKLSPKSSPSPKFMKPSELFKRSFQSRNRTSAHKLSPSKATASIRRCKLPIETVEKLYSPLKCLQTKVEKIPCDDRSQLRQITFSPLMKKLQRSPGRNQISFPVVKRSLHNFSATEGTGTLAKRGQSGGIFNRVLDFSEDAQFPPEKLQTPKNLSLSNQNLFFPLNLPHIDWSLKTRMKIVLNRTIPFHGTFNSLDEATGLNHFVRGSSKSLNSMAEDNFCSELQRHCLVWQHPHLPWMRLFPRVPELKPGSRLSSNKPPMFQISPTGSMADSLYSDFCLSLHSLFKLLKSKYCPYFYLCSNSFSVLFRACGVAGSDEAHALITPTTIGFRRLLEDEGIQFQMPFHNYHQKTDISKNSKIQDDNSKASTSSSGIEPDLEDEKDEDFERTEEYILNQESSNQWLESLGLSEQDFPSLETSSFRRRRQIPSAASQRKIDDQSAQGKVQSLIRVNGITHLQALLELFINHRKICISTSGPLAGVPPTILAPVAFHGATLTPIRVRHKSTTCANMNHSNQQNITTLDLNGPILPHTVYGLMNLFRKFLPGGDSVSQDLSSESEPSSSIITVVRSTLRTYDPSSSFALKACHHQFSNIPKDKQKNGKYTENSAPLTFNPMFSVENLGESGMDPKFLVAICTTNRQSQSPMLDFELSPNGIRYNRFIFANNNNSAAGEAANTCSGFVSVFGSTTKNN